MATGFKLDMSALENFMDGLQKRIENPQPLMRDIGELLVSGTKERMYKGVTPDGKKQEPVARGGTPLIDSADYVASFTYAARVSDVTIGTNKEQGPLLHIGGTVTPKHKKVLVFTPKGSDRPVFVKKITVKPRPHVGISEDDKAEIADTVGKYMVGRK